MLVDMLTDFIIRCKFSPSELKDAAVLAAIRHETIHARPTFLMGDGEFRRVDNYHGKENT